MSCRFLTRIRIAMNVLTAALLIPVVLVIAAFKKAIHKDETWKDALSLSFRDCMEGRWQDLLFVLAMSIIASIPICLLLKEMSVPENILSTLGWIIVILIVFVIYVNKWNQDLGKEYEDFCSWSIGEQSLFIILGILLCVVAFFLIDCL